MSDKGEVTRQRTATEEWQRDQLGTNRNQSRADTRTAPTGPCPDKALLHWVCMRTADRTPLLSKTTPPPLQSSLIPDRIYM